MNAGASGGKPKMHLRITKAKFLSRKACFPLASYPRRYPTRLHSPARLSRTQDAKRSLSIWTKIKDSAFKLRHSASIFAIRANKEVQRLQEGGPAATMLQNLDEVFENQRFYGITWSPPPALDRAGWTDGSGNPVEADCPPSESSGDWEVVVTPGTDDEGWQYGTVFHHLEYKRPGGRSSQRLGDLVRRRCWRRSRASEAHAAHAGGDSCLQAATTATAREAQGSSAEGQGRGVGGAAGTVAATAALAGAASERSALSAYEAEAKKRAMKAFMGLVLDLLQRRRVWSIIPWDPSALVLLYRKHQEVYRQLQSQAYERRLFTADQAAPPSPLRPSHRTLLQDMLAAAMHSRAAYGYPMAAGHVSSVLSYVKLQTVQQLSFDAIGGVSVEANNEAVGALAGIDPSDILLSQWKNSTYRPCHYVAIDRANQCVVLSTRGSLQVGDLLSDLSAHPMEASLGGVEEGGWVHQGIFTAATYIHCNTKAALEEAGRRCPGWPVLVTGHSLGGGVAALLAMLMKQAGLPPGLGPLHCITVGSAAVVSEKLAEACQDFVTSVVVGSDVIPHLSYASVETLLVESSQASPVRQAAERAAETLNKTINQAGSMVSEAFKGVSVAEMLQASRGGWQGVAADWAPLRNASAAGGSDASEGLGRLLPFYADEDVMHAAAQAARQAARAPPRDVERDQQAQLGQRAQQGEPAKTRMIQIIDLSRGEDTPTPGGSSAQHGAAAAAPAAGLSGDELAAATLGSSAGVEGMFPPAEDWDNKDSGEWDSESDPMARPTQQAAQPLQYPLGGGSDTPLLDSAMAQVACGDGVQQQQKTAASAAGREAGAVLGGGEGANSPEVLFPPGRIIWIFPADEDLNGMSGGDAAAVAAGVAAGTAAAAVGGGGGAESGAAGTAGGGQGGGGEVELTQAGAAAGGEQGSLQAGGTAQQAQRQEVGKEQAGHAAAGLEEMRHQSREAVADMAAKEAGHAQCGQLSPAGTAGAAAQEGGKGKLDVDEAVEGVERSEGGQEAPEGINGQGSPVVVEADRRKFERILLMPDMINDHLPDRYLKAIKQL